MAIKKEKKKFYVNVRHNGYHLRKDADKKSESIFVVGIGDKVEYLNKMRDGWLYVSVNGKKGWLFKQVGDVVDFYAVTLEVKKGKWTLRDKPDQKGKKVGTVAGGDFVEWDGTVENGWCKIKLPDMDAWISSKAIEIQV